MTKRRLQSTVQKRRTFLSTEYWTYIAAGLVMFYLDSKGITTQDVKEYANGFITKIESNIDAAKYLLIPLFISIKKGFLTWKSITEEAKVAIAYAKQTLKEIDDEVITEDKK